MRARKHSSPGRTGFWLIRSGEAYLPNSRRHLTPGPAYQIKLITFEDSLKRGSKRSVVGQGGNAPTTRLRRSRLSASSPARAEERRPVGQHRLRSHHQYQNHPRASRQGRTRAERGDALISCEAITQLHSLLQGQPRHVGRLSVGVFSAYKMAYGSRFPYGRKITSLCLRESDASGICRHPTSTLSHSQIQYFAYTSIIGKEK